MNTHNPKGFKREIRALRDADDKDTFFSWFDGGHDVEGAFAKGADVFKRLFLPYVKKYLKKHMEGTSLEIGYGSGAQIAEASKHFLVTWGVDVHEEKDYVEAVVEEYTGRHFELFVGDGRTLNFEDNSIDFVHSWTTFLHLNMPTFEGYVNETFRILKEGGIAVLYWSRLLRSAKAQNWNDVKADIEEEKKHEDGYVYGGPNTKVRAIALRVAMWKMVEIATLAGFRVLEPTGSWDGKTKREKRFYGQYGIVLQKPIKRKARTRAKKSTVSKKTAGRKAIKKRKG